MMEALILSSLLTEVREGRDPLVTYEHVPPLLEALGRGKWTDGMVRDLGVPTWTQATKNTAPFSRFLAAADDFISRRRDKPNLKVQAAATARASRKGAA
jgi:hypothetical protein